MRWMATNDYAAIPVASDSLAAPLASTLEYSFSAFVQSRPLASTTLAKMRLCPLVLLPPAAFADTIPHSAGVSDFMINTPAHVHVVEIHRDSGFINRLLRMDEPMDDEKRMSVEPFVKVFESLPEIAQGLKSTVGKEVTMEAESLHDVLAKPHETTDKVGGLGVYSDMVAKEDVHDTEEHFPETPEEEFYDVEEHFPETPEEKFHDTEEHVPETPEEEFYDVEEHFPETPEEKFHGTEEHVPDTPEEDFYDMDELFPETHEEEFHDTEEHIPGMRERDVHDTEEHISVTTKLDKMMPSGLTEGKNILYVIKAGIKAGFRGDMEARKAADRELDSMIDYWKTTHKTLDDVLPLPSGVKSAHFFFLYTHGNKAPEVGAQGSQIVRTKYDPVVDESAFAETWAWALKKFPAMSNQKKEEMEAAMKEQLKFLGRVRTEIEEFIAPIRKKAGSVMARIPEKLGRLITLIMKNQDRIVTLVAKRLTTVQNSFVYLRHGASDNVA
uniref:Uncharacterized protein n=1 Tax=Peronospora matthiolae TaxID=2874970 RepID=A0AAV1TNG7_9STRA